MSKLNGIDISAWQSGLDVAGVAADFVIIKATEGTTYTNSHCDTQYQAAVNSGKKVGVYHFADGTSSGAAEANYFYKNIKGYVGQAILVLDWESTAIPQGVAYAKEFLDTLQTLTGGVKALIYMSGSVTKAYNWTSVVNADYGLWVAYYASNAAAGYRPDAAQYNVGYWSSAAILQYTSKGITNVASTIDLDVFYGSRADWDAYAKGTGTVSAPITATKTATTTTSSSIYSSSYYLSYGDGPDENIRQFQRDCNILGYQGAGGKLAEDAMYGSECKAACGKIQKFHGLAIDCEYGHDTDVATKSEVKALQTALKNNGYGYLAVDGLTGPKTKAALGDYQLNHGLTVDYIAGPKTLAKLGL